MSIQPYSCTCQKKSVKTTKGHYHRHSERYDKTRYSIDLFVACHMVYNISTTALPWLVQLVLKLK